MEPPRYDRSDVFWPSEYCLKSTGPRASALAAPRTASSVRCRPQSQGTAAGWRHERRTDLDIRERIQELLKLIREFYTTCHMVAVGQLEPSKAKAQVVEHRLNQMMADMLEKIEVADASEPPGKNGRPPGRAPPPLLCPASPSGGRCVIVPRVLPDPPAVRGSPVSGKPLADSVHQLSVDGGRDVERALADRRIPASVQACEREGEGLHMGILVQVGQCFGPATAGRMVRRQQRRVFGAELVNELFEVTIQEGLNPAVDGIDDLIPISLCNVRRLHL